MTPARFPDDESLDRHLSRLSQIPTRWGDLREIRDGTDAAAAASRLLGRYQRAVYRYLLGALRDEHAADDLFQEFALRVVRGSFNTADPARGRFRDFLKTTLRNLIVNHHKRHGKPAVPLGEEPATAEEPGAEADEAFLERWREELLARAWEALRQADGEGGQHLYAVLRFRTDHPELRSPVMAERLAPLLGKAVSADWVRKRLQLARERYTDLLVKEVAGSLADPTEDAVAEEVAAVGLLAHCKAALERRRRRG
jgi:RNA polymerase sigma-70 factor (ECF subfamily)